MPADKKPPSRDAGPAGAFAYDMFELWVAVGKPPLRIMAEQVNMHHSSLSRVMKEDRVSSWESVRAFVIACGAAPETWEPRWQQAKNEEKATRAAARLVGASELTATPTGPPRGPARPRRDSRPPETRSTTAAQAGRRPAPRIKATAPPADHPVEPPKDLPPLPVVPEVGAGVRGLPPLPLPLREGLAERLTTTVLRQALHTSGTQSKPLLDVLARMLECEVDTAAEYLVHTVLAVRARNERLQQRLAWETPPSPYFPTHLLPAPPVQLVPSGDPALRGQLIVIGRSARQTGAHRADDEDTADDPADPTRLTSSSRPGRLTPVPPPVTPTAGTPAAATPAPGRRHGLGRAARVRTLPPPPPSRRGRPEPITAQPADALTEATGTDTVRPLTPVPPLPLPPQGHAPLSAVPPATSQQHSSTPPTTALELSTEEAPSAVDRPEAENTAHRARWNLWVRQRLPPDRLR